MIVEMVTMWNNIYQKINYLKSRRDKKRRIILQFLRDYNMLDSEIIRLEKQEKAENPTKQQNHRLLYI